MPTGQALPYRRERLGVGSRGRSPALAAVDGDWYTAGSRGLAPPPLFRTDPAREDDGDPGGCLRNACRRRRYTAGRATSAADAAGRGSLRGGCRGCAGYALGEACWASGLFQAGTRVRCAYARTEAAGLPAGRRISRAPVRGGFGACRTRRSSCRRVGRAERRSRRDARSRPRRRHTGPA